MRNKKLGKKFDRPIQKPSKTTIYVYDINKNFIGKYLGYQIIAETLSIARSSIVNCCNSSEVYNDKYIFLKETDLNLLDTIVEQYNKKFIDNIFQYTLQGDLINSFKTLEQAAVATNYAISSIGKCCSGFCLTVGGFIFLRSSDPIVITERINRIKTQQEYLLSNYKTQKYRVLQFDLNNNLIAIFNNYSEASLKTNIPKTAIKNNCNFQCRTTHNYIFKKENLN